MRFRLALLVAVSSDRNGGRHRKGNSESFCAILLLLFKVILICWQTQDPHGALLGRSLSLNKTVIFKVIKVLFL